MAMQRRPPFRLRAYWELVLPMALLVALVLSFGHDASGGTLAAGARLVAVLLLVAVTGASLQLLLEQRVALRHDSIRHDIAAAGGLGKRLSV